MVSLGSGQVALTGDDQARIDACRTAIMNSGISDGAIAQVNYPEN